MPLMLEQSKKLNNAFTLIELSIVLVIIGLITGGILVGRDLISAAGVRAQVAQIEKINAAVNTFRVKFGFLPGDIPDPSATQFGFAARGNTPGKGDGNGTIRGLYNGWSQDGGETLMFWADMSYANGMNLNLIDGRFARANATTSFSNLPPNFSIMGATISPGYPSMNDYIPKSKLNAADYLYVWSGGINGGDSFNYYTLSGVKSISSDPEINATPGVTANQAFAIDKKIDDGLPQSGTVQAIWNDSNTCGQQCYVGGANGNPGLNDGGGPVTVAGTSSGETNSDYTCYDYPNPASPTLPLVYSTLRNGTQSNCSVTFKMQ